MRFMSQLSYCLCAAGKKKERKKETKNDTRKSSKNIMCHIWLKNSMSVSLVASTDRL